MHKHDYQMEFDEGPSLCYRLVCGCGDVANSMDDALFKMCHRHRRVWPYAIIGILLISAFSVWMAG